MNQARPPGVGGYGVGVEELAVWFLAFINPIFAFSLGSAYIFFGDELFLPQTPTEYGRSVILVGLMGVVSFLLYLTIIGVIIVALLNIFAPPLLGLR